MLLGRCSAAARLAWRALAAPCRDCGVRCALTRSLGRPPAPAQRCIGASSPKCVGVDAAAYVREHGRVGRCSGGPVRLPCSSDDSRPVEEHARAGACDAQAHLPAPPSERGSWLLAGGLGLLGAGGARRGADARRQLDACLRCAPPAAGARASRPRPRRAPPRPRACWQRASGGKRQHELDASTARSSRSRRGRSSSSTRRACSVATQTHIARRWMEGFYPIYATAQRTFGVNWLLIASIHTRSRRSRPRRAPTTGSTSRTAAAARCSST